MRLTVLGCSGSMASPTSAASSYLVTLDAVVPTGTTGAPARGATALLLDLGSGAFGPLQAQYDPAQLDAVVLTHLHPDHCADLTALEVWLRYGPGAGTPPLRVLGPVGLRERILELTHMDDAALAATFALEVLAPGDTAVVGAVELSAHEALHPVPALSYTLTGPSSVHDGEARLAYTGDTDMCEGVLAAARDVDLLLCEAAFAREDEPRGVHLSGARAGRLALEAGAHRVVLTHLQPWADEQAIVTAARSELGREVELARPGAVYAM